MPSLDLSVHLEVINLSTKDTLTDINLILHNLQGLQLLTEVIIHHLKEGYNRYVFFAYTIYI